LFKELEASHPRDPKGPTPFLNARQDEKDGSLYIRWSQPNKNNTGGIEFLSAPYDLLKIPVVKWNSAEAASKINQYTCELRRSAPEAQAEIQVKQAAALRNLTADQTAYIFQKYPANCSDSK